jgi:adenosyl cobinamide kinase/adenosyl cobinamide phosphate guanylyltransferase
LPVTFIATAEAGDDEMASRIQRHRSERPPGWTTVEAPVELLSAVAAVEEPGAVIVDCLTLWVSNLLVRGWESAEVLAEAGRVAEALRPRSAAVVVSNEVGLGIVPANELARRFQDTLGSVNATFAAAASRSLLLVAGRALPLLPVDASLASE